MANRILFIELEGGLLQVSDQDLAANIAELKLQTNCFAALQRFRAAGVRLVLLVGRPEALNTLVPLVSSLFASQGIDFDAVKSCAHDCNDNCDCAAPGIGLVADFISDPSLDRQRSAVAGGGDQTLALARNMGLQGFKLSAELDWGELAHVCLDSPRRARVERQTRETKITIEVDLDTAAEPKVSTGIGFFDHMLEQLGKHGGFSLRIDSQGDLEVDEHHTVEDVALALGQALREALGDKRGIERFGFVLPMDEAQAQIAIDLSGRAYCVFEAEFPREQIGSLPTELVGHFFRSLSDSLSAALHISVRGDNTHHMIEACFKGVARCLRQALARQGSDLPSTKGSL